MDYIPPRNYAPTAGNPRPAYPDGDPAGGVKGAIPSGKAIEHPIREIVYCIEQAGKTPNANDLTQLWQAILWAVEQGAGSGGGGGGGGGGVPPSFSKMPIMPEVTTNGGYLGVTGSAGQVVVASGGTFVHRGGNGFATADTAAPDRTFVTLASKTYHLRWQYNGGAPVYALRDLADATYNPGGLTENHTAFDTTYDDMLIARVVTSSGNVPTVTALCNKATLALSAMVDGTDPKLGGSSCANFALGRTWNWARRPTTYSLHLARVENDGSDNDFNLFGPGTNRTNENAVLAATPAVNLDRYVLATFVAFDGANTITMLFTGRA